MQFSKMHSIQKPQISAKGSAQWVTEQQVILEHQEEQDMGAEMWWGGEGPWGDSECFHDQKRGNISPGCWAGLAACFRLVSFVLAPCWDPVPGQAR